MRPSLWFYEEGRFFNESEAASGAPVIVMGSEIAENLFGSIDPLGKQVRMYGSKFTVIGLLKKEGSFSVCVPCAGKYIKAYQNGEVFIEKEKCWPNGFVDTGSKLDQVNYIAYMDGEHNYMFDEENLVNTLKKAGFKKVKIREFDSKIDLHGRDFESIYAIGYKN